MGISLAHSKRDVLKIVRIRVDRPRVECPGHRDAGILPAAYNRQVILTGIFRQPLRLHRSLKNLWPFLNLWENLFTFNPRTTPPKLRQPSQF